jgi:DNA-binding beta-propeller fold protein YncE
MKSLNCFAAAALSSVLLAACGSGNSVAQSAPTSVAPLIVAPQSAAAGSTAVFAPGSVELAYAANGGGSKGCGGGGHIGDVSAYSINANSGALTPVVGSPFTTGSYPNDLAIDPHGKFAYVADNGLWAGVFAHTINATNGALKNIEGRRLRRASFPMAWQSSAGASSPMWSTLVSPITRFPPTSLTEEVAR